MKVIENTLIPFKGFLAINLFGVIFVRRDEWNEIPLRFMRETLNHEAIHTAQMKELLYIGFYILYLLEWMWRLIFHTKTAYSGISFEREARKHAREDYYLQARRRFAQWKKD